MARNFTNPDGSVRVIKRGDTFVWINNRPFNMEELGDIADMSILDGFRAMFDRGLFGEFPSGYTFEQLMQDQPPGKMLSFLGVDAEDPPMVDDAHTRLCAYEDQLGEQIRSGEPMRDDQREQLDQLMRDFLMMKKLSTE